MGQYTLETPGDLEPWLQEEAVLEREVPLGASLDARRSQEWLTLHGFQLKVDGDYGPITSRVVAQFQRAKGLRPTGKVNAATFQSLVAPLRSALLDHAEDGTSFGQALVSQALAHVAAQPREVGGRNRGPWVRTYMDGKDGPEALWCAGFVRFVLRQVCEARGVALPLPGSESCDVLAAQAAKAGLLVRENAVLPRQIKPGSVFLSREGANDWVHTGWVIEAHADYLVTVEGNTNDDGSRDGYEVCKRTRNYRGKDFIVFA
jgi:hypothetical protein